jgi:2-oxoglutarate dehydrogenase E2 component (dihydrolipoamide succinyltransferase)
MNVLMPQLGETVTEGTVSNWHKKEGDQVAADELLFDIETDKVSMEVPAPAAGVLAKILVPAGTTVDVGTVLAVIESGAAETAAAPQPAAAQATQASPAAANTPEYASMPPQMASQQAPMGSSSSGSAAAPAVAGATAAVAESSATAHHAARSDQMRLSPAVRRLAAEYRLDLAAVPGSGRNGRITRRNVLEFIAAKKDSPQATASAGARGAQPVADLAAARGAAAAPAARAPSPAPAGPPPAGAKTLPFTRIRKLTAEHMVRSKATSPHVLQAVEVDFARVDAARKTVRDAWKAKHGHSITYLPFIAHAVCEALHDFPNLNSSVHGDSLVLHDHVNLAIAVDLGAEGLVAPVIKNAERLSVGQLAGAIYELSQRSRGGRLKPDDFAGGTYTLSNSGTFGTLITAPIINQPQVAILSTDGVRKKPVVIETSSGDAIAIRPVGVLAQSFDHRAVDGAYSAAFLDRVRKLLENGNWVVEV